ncbi:MAG: nitrous oxide reductase accessory protein NosL [Flavobacteriaceae bacterium]|nr:nitrous oxide reductase accessory protein NosL [Flavobacteriaceae bacterium]
MKKIIIYILSIMLFISCKVEPKEINFGQDACHYCKMTIVDKPFASEIVNSKGKVYMYDAIECMIKNLENENLDAKMYLVYDFENTTQFINALESHFVISNKIKSPMGENLAAFKSKSSADKFLENNGGKLFNWNEINNHLKKDE